MVSGKNESNREESKKKESRQDESDGRKHPVIEVKDFGPLKSGRVELRPLTVFAGPGNTGKSWLATLIYALMKHCGRPVVSQYGHGGLPGKHDGAAVRFPERPDDWLRSLEAGRPVTFTESDRRYVRSLLESRGDALQQEILRCFGLSDSRHLVREKAAAADLWYSPAENPLIQKLALTIGKRESGRRSGCSVEMPDPIELLPLLGQSPEATRLRSFLRESLQKEVCAPGENRVQSPSPGEQMLCLGLVEGVSSLLSAPVWCLPAARGGAAAIAAALMQSASRAAAGPPFIPALPGVLADFVESLLELLRAPDESCGRNEGLGLAEHFEQKALGGRVEVEAGANPRFSWRPDEGEQPLSLLSASSTVSELAPLALYLRHRVRPGHTLILEEPEAHLHPATHVELIEQVAQWVRAGVRVVLTTHSEWMLDALSNLAAPRNKEGLCQEQIGVWQFAPGDGGGSKIREVRWSIEQGGFEAGFFDTAASLHNNWADLVSGEE